MIVNEWQQSADMTHRFIVHVHCNPFQYQKSHTHTQ